MYYLTEKRGSKRVGLAVWNCNDGQTCLALADDVFAHHGFKGSASRADVTQFKNWGGMIPGAPVFDDTVQDAERYAEKRRAMDYARLSITWEQYKDEQNPEHVTEVEYYILTRKVG